MEKFKEYSARIIGAAVGITMLWVYVGLGINPITLPYDLARWGFHAVFSHASAGPADKVWIVVDLQLPNGKPAKMSFDNPSVPDMTLDECEGSKAQALAALSEHVKAATGSAATVILGATCVVSAVDPIKR